MIEITSLDIHRARCTWLQIQQRLNDQLNVKVRPENAPALSVGHETPTSQKVTRELLRFLCRFYDDLRDASEVPVAVPDFCYRNELFLNAYHEVFNGSFQQLLEQFSPTITNTWRCRTCGRQCELEESPCLDCGDQRPVAIKAKQNEWIENFYQPISSHIDSVKLWFDSISPSPEVRVEISTNKKPKWILKSKVLSFEGKIVKRFRKTAVDQFCVLDSFEESNWPNEMLDPLRPKEGIDPKKRVRDTKKNLNKGLINKTMKFGTNENGTGFVWHAS